MKMAAGQLVTLTETLDVPLTKLDDDLPKVVRMPGPNEKADIAHLPFVCWIAPELVLLNIGNTFQDKTNGKQYYTGNVASCSEVRLVEPRDIWRVEDSHG